MKTYHVLVNIILLTLLLLVLIPGCSEKTTIPELTKSSYDLQQMCEDHDMVFTYMLENAELSGNEGDSLVLFSDLSDIIYAASKEFADYYSMSETDLYDSCIESLVPFIVNLGNKEYIPTKASLYNLTLSNLTILDQEMINHLVFMCENGAAQSEISEVLKLHESTPDLSLPMKIFVALLQHEMSSGEKGIFIDAVADACGFSIGAAACPILAPVTGAIVAGSLSLIAHHFWGHLAI